MAKAEIAKQIMESMKGAPRKDIIQAFVSQAGLAVNTATQYYHKLSKTGGIVSVKKEKAEPSQPKTTKPKATVVDKIANSLREFSGPQVVSIYNSLPNVKAVVKFATKEEGVKRVLKLAETDEEVKQNLIDRLVPEGK